MVSVQPRELDSDLGHWWVNKILNAFGGVERRGMENDWRHVILHISSLGYLAGTTGISIYSGTGERT